MKMKLMLAATTALLAGVLAWANLSGRTPPPAAKADSVLVLKSERKLHLLSGDEIIKTYNIALGGNPIGHKERQGDQRTPEGLYLIDRRNPRSAFHLSLHVSYPSSADTMRAVQNGWSPGGDIMIHGLPNGLGLAGRLHKATDWTAGCIAVTNDEIEEIWNSVSDGTPIEIRP